MIRASVQIKATTEGGVKHVNNVIVPWLNQGHPSDPGYPDGPLNLGLRLTVIQNTVHRVYIT